MPAIGFAGRYVRNSGTCLAIGLAAMLLAATVPARAAGEGPAGGRIVAVGGAVTEILHALGVADRIVAVDTTSTYPEAVRAKPNVGYMRALSAEGILSMRPSAVIAVDGSGPPDALALVRAAGVPLLTVPEALSPEGVLTRIRAVGALIGREAEAERLATRVETDLAALAERSQERKPVRALFLLSFQNGRALAAGRGTAADAMLTLAGATNVANDFDGYKPMSDEAVIAAAPEIVVMMDRAGARPDAAALFASPAFSRVPAAHGQRLVAMDGLYLLGFGPRLPAAIADLRAALAGRP